MCAAVSWVRIAQPGKSHNIARKIVQECASFEFRVAAQSSKRPLQSPDMDASSEAHVPHLGGGGAQMHSPSAFFRRFFSASFCESFIILQP